MLPIDTISADELDHYIDRNDVLIIDLRSRDVFAKNHLKSAINVPYEELQTYRYFSRKKTLILYCERGSSSLFAARELMKRGYRVKSVVGGIRSYQGSNLYFFS